MTNDDRELDLVVWGATGFTGRLVSEYLLRRYGAEGLRWALGGRSRGRLEALRDEIGRETATPADALPLVVGDADDADSMRALARRTRVVCTTVGPYAKYGSKLVAACAAEGTHYCDLTGEVHWIRRMLDRHHDEAVASGARIVFTCGFDSIPSDIGCWFVQREMRARHGVASPHVKYRVADFSGGMSGGTIASMLNMLEEAREDPEVMRTMADPYALNPKDQRFGPDGPDRFGPSWDADFGEWTAPFVMAGINTRVVRRTNALLGQPYGASFRYDEATLTGRGPGGLLRAVALSGGTAGGMAALSVGPLRRLIARRLPAPGEGPSRAAREAGYFVIRLHAAHPTDPALGLRARVRGDRDPGYGSTAKMLGESAVCLALDALDSPGGLGTPAAAMGDALLERLAASAGLEFTIE
jgi:short subunit dehydrogenase-like uncharacterized protein